MEVARRFSGLQSRSLRSLRVAACAVAASVLASVAVCAPLLSTAQRKPEEFRTAIKAQDRGDWKGSVELMRQALEKHPEDGERVRIYGTKDKSYLPHYYAGLALYKQKDCAGALKEWEECISVGAVLRTEEHEALLGYFAECRSGARR